MFRIPDINPVVETIGDCQIAYDRQPPHSIREYYLYCVSLFREQLRGTNLIFGDFDWSFKNGLPTKRVAFQYEHTLVKPGGRDSDGFPNGVMPIAGTDDFYLVRLCNQQQIENSDIVVEYSQSNIANIKHSAHYPNYQKNVLYISPSLYDLSFHNDKQVDVMTNFYDENQHRRHKFLQTARQKNVSLANYRNYYGDTLRNLYRRSKILVNIHQTDHHDTLEELRILPALRSGCIVISENCALSHFVPYSGHVVWSDLDRIFDVCKDVLMNYDAYHKSIFTDEFTNLLNLLEWQNHANIRERI